MSDTKQAALQRIFAEVLGVDQVSPQDGFFDVGGDSVLALQVVARAREAGLELNVRDVFVHQTVELLATVTGDLQDGAAVQAEPPLVTFSADELGEFEDPEDDLQGSDIETGWETVG
jgi:aryl carrier-like protein